MSLNICDMHCDSLTEIARSNKDFYDNDMHISIKKLRETNYLAQCFAVFIKLSNTKTPFDDCNHYMDVFDDMLDKYKNDVKQAKNYNDIIDNANNGLLSAILTIEEGGVIEGDINKLIHFYNRGVRMMTLTWNFPNEIGYPNIKLNASDRKDMLTNYNMENGLTDFGIEVVKKMNELGMIIDVSHLSDKGFYDVIKYSKKPIVASHSNSRAIQNVSRNLTDDMILKLKENGGVMGLNFCADFVSYDKEHQIEALIQHAKHIKEIGGIDILALGSDFDGIGTPKGMSDCTKMPYLRDELKKAGFTEEELDKIFYKNFLRVVKENCN